MKESDVKHWIALLALCSAMIAMPARGATYCVDSNLSLASSLVAAAASNEADQIRIRTGSYGGIGPIDLDVRGALTISGGWAVSCLIRSETATTTISGTSTQNFQLTQDANDLELLGLTFSGWSQVILSGVDLQFGPPTDEIRVRRSRFTNTLIGLFINAGSHNIVVENSRFDAYSDSGLRIFRGALSQGTADVLLQHNTLSNPSNSNASGLRVQATTGAPAANIRIYNTVMDGNQFDLRIASQPVLVRYSFWTTQLFSAPGGLSAGSNNNLSGDPLLDANFRPIEPTSPLINSGIVLAGSTPSTDFDGGPRVFGIRPDIGAYESEVVGTTVITVTNTADSGAGSLRAAITSANSAPGDAIIEFNIPGSCPRIIGLDTLLPNIAKTVRIEGYTQPGSLENVDPDYFDGEVCVVLSGRGTLARGLNLATNDSTDEPYVSGLGFYGFTSNAIQITGIGKAQVRGSLFGTGALLLLGTSDLDGIHVVAAAGTVIGGDSVADRNVIGAAADVGLRLAGNSSATVRNNLIGTNRSGTGSLSNAIGVEITGGDGHIIRNNTIAFNDAQAILLSDDGSPAQNVQIFNNYLGASGANLASGGNGGNAVRVAGGNGHSIRDNFIYNNQTDGIAVLAPSRRVLISGNRFRNNSRLGIDLSPDGRNFNDLDVNQTGANDRQNFPSLFQIGGDPLQGSARAQLSSANGTYRVEIYASTRCTGLGGTGFDDAAVLVGTSDPLILTCATPTMNCTGSVVVPVTSDESYPLTGKFLSALTWDEENNTSEFGICFPYEVNSDVFADGFE